MRQELHSSKLPSSSTPLQPRHPIDLIWDSTGDGCRTRGSFVLPVSSDCSFSRSSTRDGESSVGNGSSFCLGVSRLGGAVVASISITSGSQCHRSTREESKNVRSCSVTAATETRWYTMRETLRSSSSRMSIEPTSVTRPRWVRSS